MALKITKQEYEKLIYEDYQFLNKHCPQGPYLDHIKIVLADSIDKHYPSEGSQQPDTGANAINILLTAGAYLGSLVGKEVSVEPGFIYECRGFSLNENGSGTLYGKNGFCTFGSYKAVRPCR